MRSELEQLAEIDKYLGGEMTADQATAFEAQMNADPGLKSLVQDQQMLIQAVNRKAIMAEINSVAGIAGGAGAAGGWGMTQWIITSVSVVGVTVGGIVIYNNVVSDEDPIKDENTITMTDDQESTDMSDTIDMMSFFLGTDEELTDEELEKINDEDVADFLADIEDGASGDADGGFRREPQLSLGLGGGHGGNGGMHDMDDDGDKDQHLNDAAIEDRNNSIESNLVKNRLAHFPGSEKDRKDWFSKHLMYPATAKTNKVQATVKVAFRVTEEGQIKDVGADWILLKDEEGKPFQGLKKMKHNKSRKAFIRQATMIFRKNPIWVPATNMYGTPIETWETWYVNFSLYGKSSVYQLDYDEETGQIEFENEPITLELKEKKSKSKHQLDPTSKDQYHNYEFLSADACTADNWSQVEVKTMTKKQEDITLEGEGILKSKASNLKGMSAKELKKLKIKAAEKGACILYVDFNTFWGSESGKLYYYYGNPK